MKKYIKYIIPLTMAVILALNVFYLHTHGEILVNKTKKTSPNITALQTDPQFKPPENIEKDLVFIHENGFEYGKNEYQIASTRERVDRDDMNRISQLFVEFQPKNGPSTSIGLQEDDQTPIIHPQIKSGGESLSVTPYTWNNGLKPYLKAIKAYCDETQKSVIVVLIPHYEEKDHTIPNYFDLKAFTKEDSGQNVNLWVTIYNKPKDKLLDYITGTHLDDTYQKEQEQLKQSHQERLDQLKTQEKELQDQITDLELERDYLIKESQEKNQVQRKSPTETQRKTVGE